MRTRRSDILPGLILLQLLAGCGGQTSQPPAQQQDTGGATDTAATSGDAPAAADERFDPSTIDPEPVPPMFDPAVGASATGDVVPVPGPLAAGRLEAPALATIVVVENGQPVEIARDVPMRIAVDAGKSDRGSEILASLATPEAKADGGFRYFTASSGGNPPDVPPAAADKVQAGTDDAGHWHYGVMQGGAQVGLFNTLDLTGKKNIPLFPEQAAIPEATPVDMFDAVIDDQGMATLTAAGQLPDGRRLVITARSTEPVQAQKAIAEDAAASGSAEGGATKAE